MTYSANRHEDAPILGILMGALMRNTGAFILRNPLIIGGATAFLITMSYVSANAMWYQTKPHTNPIYPTRDMETYQAPKVQSDNFVSHDETRIYIEQAVDADEMEVANARQASEVEQYKAPVRKGSPQMARVQEILSELQLYNGPIDGLSGPQTREAVKRYQRIVDLPRDGKVTAALIDKLEGRDKVAQVKPAPVEVMPDPVKAAEFIGPPLEAPLPSWRPQPRLAQKEASRPDSNNNIDRESVTASVSKPTPKPANAAPNQVKLVQQGLRKFGHDQISVDGVIGSKTRNAIIEFQALFGLKETGNADAPTIAKMREIKLI